MTRAALALVCFVSLLTAPAAASAQTAQRDDVRELLQRIEQIVQAGATTRYFALLADSADRERARSFAEFELMPGLTRAVIQERDRAPLAGALPGNGYQLIVDVFTEAGNRARVATWRLDLKRTRDDSTWRIADQEQITSVEGLYRLALNPAKQFDAQNLRILAEDMELTLPTGAVFVADTDQGTTGLVLLGRGLMRFEPRPLTEKGQVKIFCGKERLESAFDAAYVRINPGDFDSRVRFDRLAERAVDAGTLRRADEIFREESPKSFGLDLGDLSREPWSLLPSYGDMLAEVRTRRFDTLTYARSGTEAEDITLFDRKRHKNIAIYPSEQKLARRGAFYNEDDLADFDVLDYDIDVAVAPERLFLEGRARIRVKVRSPMLGTITLRLADSLSVRSIVSDRFGRLFAVRVRNQNSLVLNLPTAVSRDTVLSFTIAYGGRLEPQMPDRETAGPQNRGPVQEDSPLIAAEPSFLYSNRSYWYPQSSVTDYATATIRIAVPPQYDCVASGDLAAGSPTITEAKPPAPARKTYVFAATQPLRYLSFIVSRFVRSETATIGLTMDPVDGDEQMPPLTGVSYQTLSLSVEANPRQAQRGREYAERVADIAQFYTSLLGDCPYPSFTLALVERDRPGGHSPAYFAALNQPLPTSPYTWRNDPEVFDGFPEFYLAHELAHQWWGQAVGWRNYHEQWISEGFAQYFSALYAKHYRGDDVFESVMRRLRRWGMDESPQGPVYLGYRLGHIRSEPRVFSALVYNKSAAVLHMLRRLVGDDAFFRGLRRFYRSSRFRKVGTEDFRAAMEAETKQPLERFFARWIYGSTLPKLKLGYRIEGGEVVLHVDQLGEIFDVPVTVTLQYADKKPVDVVVRVTDRAVDMRVPLAGVLRGIEFNKDDGTLADVVR
jgi:Peptidase family M1 domain